MRELTITQTIRRAETELATTAETIRTAAIMVTHGVTTGELSRYNVIRKMEEIIEATKTITG